MKNKEIEEMIQNRIDDIYQSGEYIYQAKELETILSYIEQLENKYNKAIEYINKNIAIYHKQLPLIAIDYEEVINILKGDSDE